MSGCHDCATCTDRPELARRLGRSQEEVRRLSARCAGCGHRLHRHLHGLVRSIPGVAIDVESLAVDRPPRDSPLGQLLVELGDYDDYFAHLDT
jgi:hypothetical protein